MSQPRSRRLPARLALAAGTLGITATAIGFTLPGAGATETLTTVAKVNFQPQAAAVPGGYKVDYGQAYDASRGYGWISTTSSAPQPMTAATRERNVRSEQRVDTFIHMQPAGGTAGRWELAVANGRYEVQVSVGDVADYFDSVNVVRVEGVTAIDKFKPVRNAYLQRNKVRVDVVDGKLTVDSLGGVNTKLDYIDVKRVDGSTSNPTTPSTSAPAPTTTAPAPTTTAPAPTTTAPKPTTTTTAPAPTTTAPKPTTTTTAPAPTTTTTPVAPPTSAPGNGTSGGFARWAAPSAYDALGVYVDTGNDGTDEQEAWMGRDIDYRLTFTSISNWSSVKNRFDEVTDPRGGLMQGNDRTLIIALPLTVLDGSSGGKAATQRLQSAADGANDDVWTWLGQMIKDRGLNGTYPDGRPKIALRVGWENNGDWYPWSTGGNEANFVKAWRRAHDRLNGIAPGTVWTWGLTVNGRTSTDSVEASYPGDAYVDVIEMDVYDSYGKYPGSGGDADPSRREPTWQFKQTGKVGLDWLSGFADTHKKLIGITEWGLWRETTGEGQVGGGDNPDFIAHMYSWLDQQAGAGRLAWANYFEVNTDGPVHKLSPSSLTPGSTQGSQFPKAAAKFLELFGA